VITHELYLGGMKRECWVILQNMCVI